MLWNLIVRAVGGLYEYERDPDNSWFVGIYDDGIIYGRQRAIKWEWPKNRNLRTET